MKPTKEEIEEITRIYDTWAYAYLNGDIETYNFYFDDQYHFVGSTANEHFLDRKSTTKFLEETADQLAGKVEIKNNRRIIEKFAGIIFVTEIFDSSFLFEGEWIYYGKFRFTSALQKNQEGWRFIYQHFSTPDAKAEEGQTIGTEKIAAENQMLREAVKRRTYELEQKNRELEIEAALERVRARSIVMQKSEELLHVVQTLYGELKTLQVNFHVVGINLKKDQSKDLFLWFSTSDGLYENIVHWPYQDIPIHNAINKSIDSGEMMELTFSKEQTREFLTESFKLQSVPQKRKEAIQSAECIEWIGSFLSRSGLFLMKYEKGSYSDEEKSILQRVAKVFEQTYTRFLDLQKAEEQTREAEIQLALERVRARTMAMHNSQDVGDTVATMYDQVKSLGFDSFRFGIAILFENERIDAWTVRRNEKGDAELVIGRLATNIHPMLQGMYRAWKNNQVSFTYELAGKELIDYYEALNRFADYPVRFDVAQLPESQTFSVFFFNDGGLWSFTADPVPAEKSGIIQRFAKVFGQTFRRYQDLVKAENQAREAQIEAALERVRSASMAMQHSGELAELVTILFRELTKLDFLLTGCIIWINDATSQTNTLWVTSTEMNKPAEPVLIQPFKHSFFQSILHAWKEKDSKWIFTLKGNQKKSFEKIFFAEQKNMPEALKNALIVPEKVVFSASFNNFGALEIVGTEALTNDKFEILHRFGKVFDNSYTRFNDLKKAEAQAREAIKQAAMDRVRGEIASMRNSQDLDRITPLIWNELTILGIPFIRCGVFIMDESQKLIHTFLSTPEGKAIAAFHLPYDHPGKTRLILKHWQKKSAYIDYWNDTDFLDLAITLVEQHIFTSSDQYLGTIPHGGFYLHCFPFLQGMLYVGNTGQLGEGETNLIQSVADAFSTAYARYEDFNKLEAAKQQVEKTLTDLKQAQQQLVQSEKMASLGELTAGIAHEIQNPLNFVNNFSEVNKELIEELKEAVSKNDSEEIQIILKDLSDNEGKVNQHGKRADAIVKSMLQHSRTSSGEKELVDINALCDEYVRLAYHWMRARDKSFNADFKTDFDESLPKIKVIPQDIGRVLLNIINNAFQACTERTSDDRSVNTYQPQVIVTTKKLDNAIEISIADNGPGIPEHIKDKIFQPFFTTKPTGQGTGLGLSLSYDIVKAHGGDLSVVSEKEKYTSFLIQIPIKD